MMRAHDVVVDPSLGYNLIARNCLLHGRERCLLRESKASNLVSADKMPLSLSRVVSLATRSSATVHQALFTVAEWLAVDLLL